MPGPPRKPLAERFWPKVARLGPDECWLWTGATNGHYGRIAAGGHSAGITPLAAHVVAYELTFGPTGGRWVLHKCDAPLCCNPHHLFLGDALTNNRDAIEKGRAHSVNAKRNSKGQFLPRT